ncbi:unnamed protein product [Amoebophrya sp. A120]|nr:unnamed protein product [Amoebophrya sp. A120]|eukprot:GSA120T00019780001.1
MSLQFFFRRCRLRQQAAGGRAPAVSPGTSKYGSALLSTATFGAAGMLFHLSPGIANGLVPAATEDDPSASNGPTKTSNMQDIVLDDKGGQEFTEVEIEEDTEISEDAVASQEQEGLFFEMRAGDVPVVVVEMRRPESLFLTPGDDTGAAREAAFGFGLGKTKTISDNKKIPAEPARVFSYSQLTAQIKDEGKKYQNVPESDQRDSRTFGVNGSNVLVYQQIGMPEDDSQKPIVVIEHKGLQYMFQKDDQGTSFHIVPLDILESSQGEKDEQKTSSRKSSRRSSRKSMRSLRGGQ